jgi:hypothetical protein
MRRLEETQLGVKAQLVPIIEPNRWPDEIRCSYDLACCLEDFTAQEAIIARQTGVRVSLKGASDRVSRVARQVAVVEVRGESNRR